WGMPHRSTTTRAGAINPGIVTVSAPAGGAGAPAGRGQTSVARSAKARGGGVRTIRRNVPPADLAVQELDGRRSGSCHLVAFACQHGVVWGLRMGSKPCPAS